MQKGGSPDHAVPLLSLSLSLDQLISLRGPCGSSSLVDSFSHHPTARRLGLFTGPWPCSARPSLDWVAHGPAPSSPDSALVSGLAGLEGRREVCQAIYWHATSPFCVPPHFSPSSPDLGFIDFGIWCIASRWTSSHLLTEDSEDSRR